MVTGQRKDSGNNSFSRRNFLKIVAAAGVATAAGSAAYYHAFSSKAKGKILIVGGGAAGVSMAARLSRWLDDPDITLIDPSDRQYYQPGFTLIASGVYQLEEVWKRQESCIPKGVRWIQDEVLLLNPDQQLLETARNGRITYDFLVLTPGLQINWEQVEGISRDRLGEGNAHCIYDFEGAQKTWKALQEFSKNGRKGIFTDTYTKHKCGGAPKKICLLTDAYTRKNSSREQVALDFFTASQKLYDVPHYTPRLLEIYQERDIPIHTEVRVKGIDTLNRQVYLEKAEMKGEELIRIPFTEGYDFLHFTPPMSAPDFVREAGLDKREEKPGGVKVG
ncbi:MAG: NAD(P)/FAD-dependent oxidoreductase [Tannerellaceae bacterium]|nr:NAD(P)/FAD-dependent oxidoreductase [Tannerellaceae bacterium]